MPFVPDTFSLSGLRYKDEADFQQNGLDGFIEIKQDQNNIAVETLVIPGPLVKGIKFVTTPILP